MTFRHRNALLRYLRNLLGPTRAEGVPDGDLLRRFVGGRDEAAFELLVWRHGAMVLRVCRGILGDGPDAEDAFQATFLVLVRKAGSVRLRGSVGGWLYQVAYRAALRARTLRLRRAAREQPGAELTAAPAGGGPLDEAALRELRPALHEEIQRLPAKYRTPTVLCYLQGKTHAEAARQLGWPRGTVAGRLARARRLLRARLTRRGLSLPGALLGAALAESAPAAVPAGLATNTVKAAALVAAGQATAGLLPAAAAALVEGVLKAMLIAKLKIAACIVLALAVLGSGATWFAHRALAQPATGVPAEKLAKDGDEVARLKEEIARLKKQLAATRRELAAVRREAKAQRDRAQAERDRARDSADEARRLAEQARKQEADARRAAEAARQKAIELQKQAEQQKKQAEQQYKAAAKAVADFAEQALLQKKKAEEQKKKAAEAAKKAQAERKKKERR
jgi:RNA polymerase sigma factor (sigma-70 family)